MLAYVRADDVWIFDLDRGLDVALTEGGSGQHNPIWSPDGTHIVYRSGDDIMVRPVDRSTVLEPVITSRTTRSSGSLTVRSSSRRRASEAAISSL